MLGIESDKKKEVDNLIRERNRGVGGKKDWIRNRGNKWRRCVTIVRHRKLITTVQVEFSCLYRASVTIKTLYYPTDAQVYNS